jgi:threonine dehydrogenase-like Zn-dependent dehydrogenase
MRALTVQPGTTGSARIEELADPVAGDGEMLVEGLALGVCGTDREIVAGDYGWSPPGRDRLILGHESLGRVRHASTGGDFAVGDLVVGVVRRPDPVPCGACAHGEFDMCRNGRYTERGIKELDGHAAELWTVETDYAVKLDPRLAAVGTLMEPATVVAKAWEQVDRIGARAWYEPRTVLVTGAGPIGLLAALLGAQRGLDVHVLDQVTDGPKVDAVTALGATYHHVRHHLLDRCLQARPPDHRRRRRRQPSDRARERRRLRQCQRQPTSLPGGRRRARPGRPEVAAPADHPAGAPRTLRRGADRPAG